MDCTWSVVGILLFILIAMQPPSHHSAAQGDMDSDQAGNLANDHTWELGNAKRHYLQAVQLR